MENSEIIVDTFYKSKLDERAFCKKCKIRLSSLEGYLNYFIAARPKTVKKVEKAFETEFYIPMFN